MMEQTIEILKFAKNILLVSHRRPDGDTLGSCIAMHFALQQMGKNTTLACIDEIPQRFRFLPGAELYVKDFKLDQFDLIIICDAGAHYMTGFHERYPDFLSKRIPIINIDHHASNEGFGTMNLVDTKSASATMVVYRLLKQLPVSITKEMALSLLTGIYNDTGSFMHSNTTKETFEIASELAKTGVNISDIIRPMFKQSSHSQLRIWGHVLENLRKNDEGVVSAVLSESDFKALNGHQSDTGGIVDLMNTVPDAAYTLLLAEDDGWVKGSLRTQRNDVNLSELASKFGGGGHPKASGFRVRGRLQKKIVWNIVPA